MTGTSFVLTIAVSCLFSFFSYRWLEPRLRARPLRIALITLACLFALVVLAIGDAYGFFPIAWFVACFLLWWVFFATGLGSWTWRVPLAVPRQWGVTTQSWVRQNVTIALIFGPVLLFAVATLISYMNSVTSVYTKIVLQTFGSIVGSSVNVVETSDTVTFIHPTLMHENETGVFAVRSALQTGGTVQCQLDAPSFEIKPLLIEKDEEIVGASPSNEGPIACLWLATPRSAGTQNVALTVSGTLNGPHYERNATPLRTPTPSPERNGVPRSSVSVRRVDLESIPVLRPILTFSNLAAFAAFVSVVVGIVAALRGSLTSGRHDEHNEKLVDSDARAGDE